MKKSKTVYVVTSGEYSDYGINAMFSTKELAQQYIDKQSEDTRRYGGYNIEEWVLDEQKDNRVQVVYACQLKDNGDLARQWHYSSFVKPKFTESGANGLLVWARSVVSAEHALKLAAEARQKYLRERDTQ